MRASPPTGAHHGGAEAVTILASGRGRLFPFEVHRLAFEQLEEPAGDLDDFTGARLKFVVVPQVAEVSPAAPWSFGGIDYSPVFFTMSKLARCPLHSCQRP
jgi:hypothetical protein